MKPRVLSKNNTSEEQLVQTNRINNIEEDNPREYRRGEFASTKHGRVDSGLSKNRKFALAAIVIAVLAVTAVLVVIYFKSPERLKTITDSLHTPTVSPGGPGAVPVDLPSGLLPQSSNERIKRGREAYAKKYYRDAAAEFTEVVDSDSSDADKSIALFYLGMISFDTEEYAKAAEYFKRAITFDSSNTEALKRLSMALRYGKHYDEAIAYSKSALDKNPNDTDMMLLLGNIYYEMGRYADAAAQYRQAVNKAPENPRALYNLASAMLKLGDDFSSAEYFKRAADLDKYGDVAYRASSSLGIIYTEKGDNEQAVKYLKQAVSIRPNNAANHYNLGLAYLKAGREDEALKELALAEQYSANEEQVLENIGEMYGRLNRYDKSIEVYNKILQANGRSIRALSRIGEIYYKNGELDKAFDAYKKITIVEPAGENARNAYLNMGNILDDAQRYDEAAEAYQKALSLNSKDDGAYYNLGLTYKHGGKPELAISAWQEAARLNTVNPAPRLAIADYYYESGFFDLAEKEYRDILDLWPDLQDAHFKMGSLYFKQNQYSYAYKAFERAAKINATSDIARKAYVNMAVINADINPDEAGIDESLNLAQKALLLKPSDNDALLTFAILLAKKGQQDRAIDTFYQVIKNTRDSATLAKAYNNIGKTYFAQKDYKKALHAFSRAGEEDPSNEEIRMNRRAASQAYEQGISSER